MDLGTLALAAGGILLALPLAWAIRTVVTTGKWSAHRPHALLLITLYGIGLAIGVPAYNEWQSRAHVSQMLALASSPRGAVEHALREGGKPPATLATPAGISYDASDGSLAVSLREDVLGGQPVLLLPAVGPDRTVTWKCTTRQDPDRFRKYLPADCR